jgi:non-ribosomal peptide synthetase component F
MTALAAFLALTRRLTGSDEEDLTYAELRARALTLASRLRGLGVGPGDRVGLSVGPGPERVIGLLGIAEAGGAYVPLDPAYPAARLELMLADAKAKAVIREPLTPVPSPTRTPPSRERGATAQKEKKEALEVFSPLSREGGVRVGEGGQGGEGPETVRAFSSSMTPDSPAYIIYTSGSTGTPKGVVLDHRGRVNNFADFNRRFGVGPGDRLLAVSSLSFDMTAYDVFGSLMAGQLELLGRPNGKVDRRALLSELSDDDVQRMVAERAGEIREETAP